MATGSSECGALTGLALRGGATVATRLELERSSLVTRPESPTSPKFTPSPPHFPLFTALPRCGNHTT